MRSDIQLGCEATDTISGFTGVVVCIANWLNDYQGITLESRDLHEGKPVGRQTFDVKQVSIVSFDLPATPTPTGGPSIAPATPADPSQ